LELFCFFRFICQLRDIVDITLVATCLCGHFKPSHEIRYHFAIQERLDSSASSFVRLFEPVLDVEKNG